MTDTKRPARTYLRCRACLTTVVVEGKVDADAACGGCGGTFSVVGKVKGKAVFRDELRCACDGRCTNAPGPACDCSCGGANHGTGRVVTVEVEAGRAVVRTPDPATAAARAAEYRAALAAADAAIVARHGRDLERYKAGEFLPRPTWDAIERDRAARRHAAGLKTHSKRVAALRAVAGQAVA